MRFAYIDSQGSEVQLPSEDALRLRIELGAIVESTSFFDGGGAGWAPAREHEIFRRLRRDLDGIEHPDPVPVGDLGPGPGSPPEPPVDEFETTFDFGLSADEGGFEQTFDLGVPPEDVEDDGLAFDGLGDFGALDLDVSGPVEPRASAPSPETPPANFEDPADSAVEEEDPWTVPGRDPWTPEVEEPSARPSSMESVGFGDEPAPPPEPGLHPFDVDEEIPDWLREDPEFGGEAPAAESSPAPSFPTRDQVRERYEHEVKSASSTPSAPGRTRPRPHPRSAAPRRGFIAAAGFVVVVATGWYFMSGAGGGDGGDEPEVELPAISPTLLPVSREASARAAVATVAALRALPAREAVPDEPDEDWLGGEYMANAGDYTPVRLYWEAMGRYVQVMRAREGEVFAEQLTAALDTVPLAADDRAEVETRSLAGFAASAPDRDAVYGQLRAVADAALRLQVFLEQNEDLIDYEPAIAGLSRDPVLEAVPVTESLGEEVWNRVAEITSALDALGFLDRVTTDQLLDVFFAKLESIEVR